MLPVRACTDLGTASHHLHHSRTVNKEKKERTKFLLALSHAATGTNNILKQKLYLITIETLSSWLTEKYLLIRERVYSCL
jgi:hypothetical protein